MTLDKLHKEMPLPSVVNNNWAEVAAYNIGYNDALKLISSLFKEYT